MLIEEVTKVLKISVNNIYYF